MPAEERKYSITAEEAEEIENNEEELKRRIDELKRLVLAEKKLFVRNDVKFMLRYLRCSNYDPELAIQKMRNYYQIKLENPDWFSKSENLTPHEFNLSRMSHYVLEDRDPSGKRVYVTKLANIAPSKTTMAKLSQMNDLFLESILDEEDTQKHGVAVLVDMKGYSWSLLRLLTPSNVKIAAKKAEALPFKKMEFHVVNTSMLLNASLKLVLPFLGAKTKDNIHFHFDNLSSLHNIINPSVLPEEYGGQVKNLNVPKIIDKLLTKNLKTLAATLPLGYKSE